VLSRPEPKYLTAADLRVRFHCSLMWITRHIAGHDFPKPIKFGNGVGVRRLWLRTEVETWEISWINQTAMPHVPGVRQAVLQSSPVALKEGK
jgi:predicted DNA-binding transcriptional regulator AlpA